MSSYIMHICVSDIVKRKLNLTDKFIYGSVLPDVLKGMTKDRQLTHYLTKVKVNGEIRNLPDIQKAINELKIEDQEIKLGYIAHLIEDLIWFNDFIPTYASKIQDEKYVYLNNNCIKSQSEFRKDIYLDYFNSGAYIIEKTNTDIERLKSYICDEYMEIELYEELVLGNTQYNKVSDIEKNIFMTKEEVDKYIEKATQEVEKIVLKLMGE